MNENPYASPAAATAPQIDADREIGVVVRVFRYIGWTGIVLYVLPVIAPVVMMVHALIARSDQPLGLLFVAWIVNCSIAGLFVAFAYVASKMARRDGDARARAMWLCYLMLLGFPVFTIVGIACIRRLNRYWSEYCDGSRAAGIPDGDNRLALCETTTASLHSAPSGD